jgi:hypothetical protein
MTDGALIRKIVIVTQGKINVSRATVNNYRARRTQPDYWLAQLISEVIGAPAIELFGTWREAVGIGEAPSVKKRVVHEE